MSVEYDVTHKSMNIPSRVLKRVFTSQRGQWQRGEEMCTA